MNKIYDLINRKDGKYRDVRFPCVKFSRDGATVSVLCGEDNFADVCAHKDEITKLVKEVCAFNTEVSVEIAKIDVSPRAVREKIIAFTHRFPYIASACDSITVSDGVIGITVHKSMYNLAKDDYFPRLNEFLANNFLCEFKVDVKVEEFNPIPEEQRAHEQKKYNITDITPVYGDITDNVALSCADVAGNNDGITVCGVITMITDCMSKGAGAKRSRPYVKFLLYDGEKSLQCRYFPQDDESLFSKGVLGKKVCIFGNSELERGRDDECSMTARSIALCEADGLNVVPVRPAPKEYAIVSPQPYEEYVQASLFGGSADVPDSLRGTFVAFDFETTGLSIVYDKPTELGAVKIVDGMITETFSTFIDPRRPIPEIVSKKTGITDDMVKGQPVFEDILPDFYKFTYGAALVGHNIAFDFPFLIKFGNKTGWAFGDRRTFDTMGMAPKAIPGIAALNLDSVLEKLGLVNDNAHRALSDAKATAKAFIAMSKILSGQK